MLEFYEEAKDELLEKKESADRAIASFKATMQYFGEDYKEHDVCCSLLYE